MPKYRVLSSRFDVSETIAGVFEAPTDSVAKIIFQERFKNNENFAWDYLVLRRIDQEEKTTLVEAHNPNTRSG